MFDQLSRKKSVIIGGLLLLFTFGVLVSGKEGGGRATGSLGVVAAPVFQEVISNALRILDIPPDDLPALAQSRREGA